MENLGNAAGVSEIEVLAEVERALNPLEPPGVRRILAWLNDKYGVVATQNQPSNVGGGNDKKGAERSRFAEDADFASLFSQAQPQSEKDKALIAGYWFNVIQGMSDLDGFVLNRELKNLGHPISNITKALGYLIDQRPQLVIQVRKSGVTKQARKKYRLTTAGIAEAETMISRNSAL